MKLASAFVILVLISTYAFAQSVVNEAKIKFEVVSVRPNNSGGSLSWYKASRRGLFLFENASALELILLAYKPVVRPLGGPNWISQDRFDVRATTTGADPSQHPLMLQSLLEDRFALRLRREIQNVPAYALVRARADGRLGPNLKPSAENCDGKVAREDRQANTTLPPCAIRLAAGVIQGHAVEWSPSWFNLLRLDGPIIDETGLSGRVDIDMKWTPDLSPGVNNDPLGGLPWMVSIEEQLGLKVKSITTRREVLVIENVDHPSEN